MEDKELRTFIFDFVYNMAINDATIRTDAASEKSEIRDDETIKSIVRKHIDNILSENNTEDFNKTVEEIENVLVSKKPHSNFTFGNIQKLINMTAKYIYISCYSDRSIRERFNNCDCPMDSIMIEIVTKKYKKKGWAVPEFIYNGRRTQSWIGTVSWSKIIEEQSDQKNSRKRYDEFQSMVRKLCTEEEITPLEFDLKYWKPRSVTKKNDNAL